MEIWIELGLIVLLALANGLFSGAEIAMLSVRKGQLIEHADAGSAAARTALSLRAHPERFLATVQVGITVIGASAAAFGGASLARRLADTLERFGLRPVLARDLALALVIALVSYLSLVLGELVPKSLALRYSERYTLLAARPLAGIAWLARPLVWFLTASSNVVLRAFGDRTSFSESRLSPEELQQLVEEASVAGQLDPHAGELAARAIDLPALRVEAVKVARTDVVALRRERLREDLLEALGSKPHLRYPVIDRELDDATSYVVVRRAARWLAGEDSDPEAALRPLLFVPESRRCIDVLREMQRSGTQLAMVVDEQGVATGVVTLEDLVEELVGDIRAEDEKEPPMVTIEAHGVARVRAKAPVHEINRQLSLELPEGPTWTTIGGLVIARAGRIPKPGARIEVEGTTIEVLDASPRRVLEVRIHHQPPDGPGSMLARES